MRKYYPYLRDSYLVNTDLDRKNQNFLSKISYFINQKQYVQITLLDWQENPLKQIEGELVSGSITKDGKSSVRRTCNFSCTVGGGEYSVEDGKADFAINKKIFVEFGIRNDTDEYLEYPILWFPQGVFFISNVSITSSTTSAVNISLTLKDKMCMLNGEIGGSFTSTTILDTMDTQLPNGMYVSEKVLVYNLIQELVHHFGGEDLNNIVIDDVPLRIQRVMRWIGENPLYMVEQKSTAGSEQESLQNVSFDVDFEALSDKDPTDDITPTITAFVLNDDVGYIYDDFVLTGELVAAPGENVCSVLDQIKAVLGNYEYYYDEFGVFHFQEIKNYMNTTQGKILLDEMSKNQYIIEIANDKTSFAFSDDANITSITVNPQYGNIKNDYIVQGLRKMTDSDISYPITYHLVIDNKPEPEWIYAPVSEDKKEYQLLYGEYNYILIYEEEDSGLYKAAVPVPYILDRSTDDDFTLPAVGNFNIIYAEIDREDNKDEKFGEGVDVENLLLSEIKCEYTQEEDAEGKITFVPNEENNTVMYYWDGAAYQEVKVIRYYPIYYPKDWRTKLYMDGVIATNRGTEQGYYYPELAAYWPTIYDIDTQTFWDENRFEGYEDLFPQDENITIQDYHYRTLTTGNYYLDFIDPVSSGLGEYAVETIGRRQNITVDDEINCLFQPEIPNVVFINIDNNAATMSSTGAVENEQWIGDLRQECVDNGKPYTQVRGEIYNSLATGGYYNGAFDQIKYDLYLHTNYQRTLSMTCLPAFWLEPNTRARVDEMSTNTHGDFLVNTISLTLGTRATMSVSCSEVFERF